MTNWNLCNCGYICAGAPADHYIGELLHSSQKSQIRDLNLRRPEESQTFRSGNRLRLAGVTLLNAAFSGLYIAAARQIAVIGSGDEIITLYDSLRDG